MAFQFSPKIVTDGLVLYLDAGNTKSYPGTGVTWSGLSKSNNNGTLILSPTFDSSNGGSIVFNGSNQYIDCGNTNLGINAGSTQITLETWVYPTSFISFRGLISRVGGTSPFGGWMIYMTSSSKFGFAVNISGVWTTMDGPLSPLSTNNWYHVCGTYNGTTMNLYINGLLASTTNSSGTIQYTGSLSNLGIGYNGAGSSFFPGRIAIAKIYSKSLSSQEVLQNYNATKSRFGL
jgi:hypothetical protein